VFYQKLIVLKEETSIFLFYKKMGDRGGLSDCEELSGGYSQEMMGVIDVSISHYKFTCN
jgi:hypothetical protein